MIDNKIVSKINSTALWSNPETVSQTDEQSIKIPKEIYISLERRQWTIDEHKFIYDNVISKNYTIR